MYTFVAWVAFLWFFVLFCDTIFKTCMFHPYFRALQLTGLDIKPLMIYVRITRYNRFINQMGRWRSSSLKMWFNTGAIITCIIIGPCLMLYLVTLYQMYYSSSVEDYDSSLLLPVIPGYNFPLSHWMYYITVILLSSIIHEFGHALAASRERISIQNFGFALCAVLPLSFVNLRFEQFRQISKWQQMRIVCAGIWHNIILALLALFFCIFLTILLAPLYAVGSGVTVLGVHQQSGLNHPAGFEIGDQINGIGDCNIDFHEHWKFCLKEMSERPQQGLCVPENTYSKSMETCLNSSGYLHFQASKGKGYASDDVCLHARLAIHNFSVCDQTSVCKISSSCMFPMLPSKMHRFVVIKRHHKQPVLYVGTMDELFSDVQISRFIQKYKLFPVSWAESIATLLEYVIMFSCGLACLNMLPILSLDGQFIIELLIHICFESFIPSYDQRRSIFICINRVASGIVICLTLLTVYKFYIFVF